MARPTSISINRVRPASATGSTRPYGFSSVPGCPLGYAPASSGPSEEEPCMHCGGRWRDAQHWEPGSRSNVLKLREAHQTVVYAGWGWIDLVAMREQLEEALTAVTSSVNIEAANGGEPDPLRDLARAVDNAIRALPATR